MTASARSRRRGIQTLLLSVALGVGSTARAQENAAPRWDPGESTTSPVGDAVRPRDDAAPTDGVYGRFEGDLDFGLGLGAELDEGDARGTFRTSLHYFYTAGLYATYRDAFSDEAEVRRVFSLGVDMRPAFIPRWSKNMQQGPGFLDLALDSISLGLGAFWEQPQGRSFASDRGFETSLGFGVPLLGTATGPWFESRAQLAFRGSESARPEFFFLLGFHALALSPLARAQ
ncbi:MAG TPA: hypothetical protein VK524_07380 [Polyangiaceae bacterium]|nr:hypothetical protein [Polyangiaceae bacterium]